MIQDLDGERAYQDDAIILGATEEQHDSRLESVLSRLIRWIVSIKATKCKFGVLELKFLDFKIKATGYQPDPGRLKQLVGM